MPQDLIPLVNAALEAAFMAGREILTVYGAGPSGSSVAATRKADDSPLTEADTRAHAAIAAALARTGLPVLSEEGSGHEFEPRQAWQRYWLVDPLDGTKEFIKRNGEFTVNIALMERDAQPCGPLGSARPIAGVIHVPVQDLIYFAWANGGAYRQASATRFTGDAYERALSAERLPVQHHRSAFTIATSRSHRSPETEAFIARMEQEHGEVRLATLGSALKICLVAEGAADAYPRHAPTMEWDTAAGHAIVQESGKQLIDITTGEPMRYNKASLVNNGFIVQ
jgi:3'(2'), 5'-bisphosphate nucleotidase